MCVLSSFAKNRWSEKISLKRWVLTKSRSTYEPFINVCLSLVNNGPTCTQKTLNLLMLHVTKKRLEKYLGAEILIACCLQWIFDIDLKLINIFIVGIIDSILSFHWTKLRSSRSLMFFKLGVLNLIA